MAKFIDIAKQAAQRGLKVTPLRGKAPFLHDWNGRASMDPDQLEQWAEEFPDANAGIVVDPSFFVVDVDALDWFMENCPSEPAKTLMVRTGSGKLHVYFKESAATKHLPRRAVVNPRWRSAAETPGEPNKLLEYPDQVVAPGSVHPETKREYKVLQDLPISDPPQSWVDWLSSLASARASDPKLKVNPLRAGWDPDVELAKAGLKFQRSERDGKVYYNYHADHGKCLVKGSSHAAQGETPNPRQSAFVYNPSNNEFWHQCFSGGCQVPGKTGIALAALGLSLDAVVRPRWRGLFESPSDFKDAPPLKWVVQGLAHEESMNMIGGLSGQGKTWLMMLLAKALCEGGRFLDTFDASQSPAGVMYLVPEVGRRSFWKRLEALKMAHLVDDDTLLVRTMSMGPTVPLSDREVLKAAKGRDVVLDTAIRFLEGDENASDENNLAESGFALLNAGARSWWGVHHSPKSFAKETLMTLEGVLRGTGDLGAMLSNCYGVRMLDAQKTLLHVECVKGRDLDEVPRPFQCEGRPWVDAEGRFRMVKPPGTCGFLDEELKLINGERGPGRPPDQDKIDSIVADKKAGMKLDDIAKKHGMTRSGVCKILKKAGQRDDDQEEF